MRRKMQNWLSANGSRVPDSVIAKLVVRNANDQMKASRAEQITSCDAVPEAFKNFTFSSGKEEFPYAVRTPAYEVFIRRTTEKLICDFGHEIWVLEKSGTGFDARCYPVDRISYIEVKTCLLVSGIKICGVTEDGDKKSSTLKFSSLTDYLFTPIIQRMRHAPIDAESSLQRSELEKFDAWRGINLKFMNYAKRSLLADERVIHTIFQPEIRETVLHFMGRAYERVIAPTLACILTNQELIMIQEEKHWGGEDKYGGIWDYIPLNKIMTLSLNEKEKNLLGLSVQLIEGTRLEFLFQCSAKREISRLQYYFKELMIA
jgi:hypothetical protein